MATLTGQVALVTGASRGIGRAIALRLAQEGASLAIHYAGNAKKAQEVISEITAIGGTAFAVQADLTKLEDICYLFTAVLARFHQLNIVVVSGSAPMIFKSIAEVTEAEYELSFSLNAKGTLFVLQQTANYLANGGRVVSLSSPVTKTTPAGLAVTAGSKAALEQFTVALAKELGNRQIRVNIVTPGPTGTEELIQATSPERLAELANQAILKRLGEPKDIADVVAWLVSDEARWITGQNISATGGYIIG